MTPKDSGKPATDSQDPVTDCRLLIVEDTLLSREMIGAYLRADGFRNIEFAVDGIDALEKAESFRPDLMVLDIVMPRMDGFEVCRRLRAQPAFGDLPVLVQTALDEPEERVRVFHVGATDMVTKPINKAELLARVRIHLENRILLGDLRAYRERTMAELNMARGMQAALLPDRESYPRHREIRSIHIASHFETSSELGGDFFGLHEIDADRLAVFMVDFSGHGVTAALNTFRLHTLIQQQLRGEEDPAGYLSTLNARLAPLLPVGQYCTMFHGVIDTRRDLLTYATAASTSPIVCRPGSTDLTYLDGSGVPLGVLDSADYENREQPFPPGSMLFLYSDALTETVDGNDTALFEPGLKLLGRRCLREGPPEEFLDRLMARFFSRVQRPLPDDLTAISLVRRTEGA